MIPTLVNNPLFRGITPEKLLADLEEISFHTRSYKKGEILARKCKERIDRAIRDQRYQYIGEEIVTLLS